MTRTGDVAIPTVTPHPVLPGTPLARWKPWRPVFALEQLPQSAYVWDDTDPAVVWDAPAPITSHGYLQGGSFSVTTPDPGVPQSSGVTIIQRSRLTTETGSAFPVAARQNEGADPRSWQVYRNPGATNGGRWWYEGSPDGVWATRQSRSTLPADQPAPALNVDETVAIAITPNNGSGRCIMRTWTYDDATATWTARTSRDAGTAVVPFDVSTVIRVGTGWGATSRIYSMELRTGTDPRAGTVVWRFDADDYPGTGTTYTDPRGRVWTLSAAGAIVPKVQGEPPYVWDAPLIGGGFSDAACDWIAFDVDPGDPDELYVFPAVSATLTLDNRAGTYTPWSADGRLVYWAPGRRMQCYWLHTSTAEKRWLFAGRVASWQVNADDTVTVVAYDGFPALAQQIGPWTPGAAGDTPRARIQAIATVAQYTDPIVTDIGDVTLSTAAGTDAPLDQIELAALSDGGLFYSDADGSLRYVNRLWRAGRTDAPRAWTVSDNVCSAPVVVWNPEMAADDERLATVVRLANVAGLIATATSSDTLWAGGARWVLTHPDPDLWQTQGQGDTLAAHLLAQQSTPSMALSRFDVYGLDPRQPAVSDFATDVRRGDRLNVVHEFVDPDGATGFLDLYAIVLGVGHSLTPDEWVSHYQLSRTVDWRTVETWDRTVYVWDEVAANNVWRY